MSSATVTTDASFSAPQGDLNERSQWHQNGRWPYPWKGSEGKWWSEGESNP